MIYRLLNSYKIRIGHTIVAEDKLYVDRKLAMPGDETQLQIHGLHMIHPLRCFWIEQHLVAKAEANHYMIIEPEVVT